MARRRRNPWTSTGEVLIWIFFVLLLFPAGFAGWAIGHYTSLGTKPPATVTRTVSVGGTTSTATTAPSTTPATTTSGGGGNAAAIADGKALFASSGCASCHTFQPAGSNGTIGPNLDTAPSQDAKTAGMPLPAFVKESIVNPDAYIAKGFTKPSAMPGTFGSQLKPTQIDDLVAFVVSGAK